VERGCGAGGARVGLGRVRVGRGWGSGGAQVGLKY
jgi:hypothetical protein